MIHTDYAALEWILNLGSAIGNRNCYLEARPMAPSPLWPVFDVVYCASVRHKADDAFPRLSANGKDCMPIYDALSALPTFSSAQVDMQACTESNDIIDEYNDNEFNFKSSGLLAVGSVATSKPDTGPTPATLTGMLAKRDTHISCQSLVATPEIPSSRYWWDLHA